MKKLNLDLYKIHPKEKKKVDKLCDTYNPNFKIGHKKSTVRDFMRDIFNACLIKIKKYGVMKNEKSKKS